MIRGSQIDSRWFALALCDAAMRDREAVLAEVFIRVARSRRLDWSATGGPSEHRREESGVALRVWDGSGREGFVHADDVPHRSIEELVRQVHALRRVTPIPGEVLVPRLPAGHPYGQDRSTGPLSGDLCERLFSEAGREWLLQLRHEIVGSRHRDPMFRGCWLEAGQGRTWIVNSRGLDITFPFALGSAGLQLRAGVSTMQYAVSADRGELPRPRGLVEKVEHEARAFGPGDPVPEGLAPIIWRSLEPGGSCACHV